MGATICFNNTTDDTSVISVYLAKIQMNIVKCINVHMFQYINKYVARRLFMAPQIATNMSMVKACHSQYSDVIIGAMASQITSLAIVYSAD